MKLTTILVLSFIFVGLVGSIGGTYYYYNQSYILLEKHVAADLKIATESRADYISYFLEEQKNKIKIAATHQDLSNEELKDIVATTREFYEVFVLDSYGKVIFSSDEAQVGENKSNDDYFLNVSSECYIKDFYKSDVVGKDGIVISVPFREGVLVARILSEGLNEIVSQKVGFGESGEVYIINKDNFFITPSKYLDDAVLNEKMDNDESIHCFPPFVNEDHLTSSIYLNYNGVKVVGFHYFIEEMNWCLIAEMNEAESLGIVRNQLINTSILIMIVIFILFSIVGFVLAHLILTPIKKLTSEVEEITKGKLDIQLEKSNIFEVQKLMNSLNRILASLKLAILRSGSSVSDLGLGDVVKAKEEAEEKYKILYESSLDAIMILAPPTWNFIAGNPATIEMFGAKDEKEFISKIPGELSPAVQPDKKLSKVKVKEMIELAMKNGFASFNWVYKKINGEEFPAHVLLKKVKVGNNELLQATVRNTSDIEDSNNRYENIISNMSDGYAYHKIILDKKGEPVDYKFLDLNKRFEELTGLKKEDILGKNVKKVIPGIEKDLANWIKRYGEVALRNKSIKFSQYSKALNKNYDIFAYSPKKEYFVTIFKEVPKGVTKPVMKKSPLSFVKKIISTKQKISPIEDKPQEKTNIKGGKKTIP